jgi:poly(A) polymerase
LEPRILERTEHPISRRDIDANVLKVLYRLINAGHLAYLVGGGVRDLMLGRRPKDFDVATSAHPQQVRDLFRNSRLIGRRFRLVHVFFGPQNIEVSTFRRRSEDLVAPEDPLIRSDNTFGTPEEDAFRRDFTVNALFYDPRTYRVIDYAGGVDDLNLRLIRTIGDPEVRMREDPARMMRAVRFAAKLGFEIEVSTRAAIERHRGDLAKASVPRLVEETYRTLGQPEAAQALCLMDELGLLEMLLPFLSAHLRKNGGAIVQSPTARNMAALGRSLEGGLQPDRGLILASMFLDRFRAELALPESARIDLVAELRARGFARGDTDHARLLLEAFGHLAAPSRRTRRLMRRPYFHEARRFFEMMAPTYGIDQDALMRFLASPEGYLASRHPPHALASTGAPPGGGARRRRRRRRRRGRRGGGRPAGAADGAPAHAAASGASPPGSGSGAPAAPAEAGAAHPKSHDLRRD